jgi:hypothetical protein
MTRKEELLAGFDDVWSHRWESMELVFKDVTEEEANYQHESYLDAEQYPGDPPSGTIKWYVHHLAHCYDHYKDVIAMRPAKPENPPPPEILAFDVMLDTLRRYRRQLRDTIATLPDDALDEKVFNGDAVAMFVRMVIRHDAWHAGQIAVARRLYRMRPI